MLRYFSPLALCCILSLPAGAQSLDVDALIGEIDAATTRYDRLIEILEGTDATRSIAAFDAMVGTEDPTMIEIATTAGLASTDGRLRARARCGRRCCARVR